MTVAEILALDPASWPVLQKHGLGSNENLAHDFEALCNQLHVEPTRVKSELKRNRFLQRSMPMEDLIEGILRQHQAVNDQIQRVPESIACALRRRPDHRYALLIIKTKFCRFVEQLEMHLYKEEHILFPEFLKQWGSLYSRRSQGTDFPFAYPIAQLESEHEAARRALSELREVEQYFDILQVPDPAVQAICTGLNELERTFEHLANKEETLLFSETLHIEHLIANQ